MSPGSGRVRQGESARYAFILSKAAAHSSVHSNFAAFFIALKNGKHTSPDRAMKRLRAARRPVRDCSSLRFLGGAISSIALDLEGLISIPLIETRSEEHTSELQSL